MLHDVTDQQQLSKLREDLTRMLIHDLRAPVSSIASSLQWIQRVSEGKLEGADEQILDLARANADDMLRMINDIMDINRLEAHQMPIDTSIFSISDLFCRAITRYEPLALAKTIQLVQEADPNLPLVLADETLIARVLQNLIDNAIKFSNQGGVIRLNAGISPTTQNKIIVSIEDTGARHSKRSTS